MIAIELGATRVHQALRAMRALGAHRYVAGRSHMVHAFAFRAIDPPSGSVLAPGCAWAGALLDAREVDPASRDERLWRRCTEDEFARVIEAFWTAEDSGAQARARLRALLVRHECRVADRAPFDEAAEAEMHPMLVDAGWELLPLSELDPVRHGGAIGAFGGVLEFASAVFEEATAIPPPVHLCELPAFGPSELLHGVDEQGQLVAPLVVWAEGHPTYLDYVVRGVRRAAKLPEWGDRDNDDV